MSEMTLAVIAKVKEILRSGLDELEKLEKALKEAPPSAVAEIEFRAEELEKLPWKAYPSGRGSWVFSNLEDPIARHLRELLAREGGAAELHGVKYRFSGQGGKFIVRSK
jgi:hypothetical protein